MSFAAETPYVSKSGLRSGRSRVESPLQIAVVRAADVICHACLGVIVFAVPLMMAGIRETGIAVFVGCSLLMSVAWAIHYILKPQAGSPFTIAVALAFAALALVGLQLVPLPKPILEQLSPFSAEFFPAWNSAHASLAGHGYWDRISLTPGLTRSGLVLLIAYVGFFLTLLQRLKTMADVDSMLKLVSIATFVMAIIALGQLFFGNGDFLWMFHHPFRDASWPAKGTFTNQNHFAHFLALGIGPLVWSWKKAGTVDSSIVRGRVSNNGFGVSRSTESYQQAIGGALAIVVFAGVLSFSRGGIAAITIACAISLAALGRQWTGILKLAIPTIAFMVIGVFLFGTDMLEAKWQRITEADSLEDICRGRSLLWTALLTAAPSFWPAGAGVGSHAEVYPTWMQQDIGKRLSHAESGYLQVLIETGLTGLILVLAALVLCTYWLFATWTKAEGENRTRLMIISAGLTASAVHSFVDFVWYIPACLIFALILAACLCRIHQLTSSTTADSTLDNTTRPVWPTCWAMIVVLLILPVGRVSAETTLRDANSEASWMSYREQSVAAGIQGSYESLDAVDERLDLMVTRLEECLHIDPNDFRAMSDLSTLYLRRFERNQQTTGNPMSVQEIRNTVESTEFDSPKDVLKWLRRAFGENSSDLYRSYAAARKAVHGQPLRGECYLVLAQLGFLRGATAQDNSALIEQAIRIRPYSAPVLYFAGMSEAENGDIEKACEWWKKSFHLSNEVQPLIVRTLATHLEPQEIVERIEPGPTGLWLLYKQYNAQSTSEERKWVADWYDQKFSTLAKQITNSDNRFWIRSCDIFKTSGKNEKAVYCLSQAVREAPDNYALRKRLGLELLAGQVNDAAVRELEWCLLRNPDDREITDALQSIRQSSLQGGRS